MRMPQTREGDVVKELAEKIREHLARFEADPVINAERFFEHNGERKSKGIPFFHANAYYPGGPRIGVVYVSYQGSTNLTRDEAEAYLAWLDAGNVGTHFRMKHEAKAAAS